MAEAFDPPYRFPGTVGAGTVAAGHESLEPGAGSGVEVAVAGRLMRNRPQGRVAFAELRDWSGEVQLFATAATTESFEEFIALSLGDWVGVRGEIVRTRRGELSVSVREWSLLAKARRGFGDKWKGVNDVEIRSRQREVDLWANEGVRDTFLLRSRVVQSLRRQLWADGFVEVETPMLQPLAGGGTATPFQTEFKALHADFFLRIAPELYLKRLLVGGFERVFELGRVFRNEGLSPRHNPEFTMLEIYEAYTDYNDAAALIERLVSGAATELYGSPIVPGDPPLDLTPPWPKLTMNEAIEQVTGEAVSLEMGEEALRAVAARLGAEVRPGLGAGGVLFEIYERTTEANLTGPVHVIDYPQEVSPLSRRHRSKPGYVERLTPIIAGREIGEAYSELIDPDDQRARFLDQVEKKRTGVDDEAMPLDEDFLRGLEHGMPPAGGIGIGIDRLMMVLAGKSNIREVVLFPALRPLTPAEIAADSVDDPGTSETPEH